MLKNKYKSLTNHSCVKYPRINEKYKSNVATIKNASLSIIPHKHSRRVRYDMRNNGKLIIRISKKSNATTRAVGNRR